jgi:hypothetical protein
LQLITVFLDTGKGQAAKQFALNQFVPFKEIARYLKDAERGKTSESTNANSSRRYRQIREGRAPEEAEATPRTKAAHPIKSACHPINALGV